MTTNLNSDHRRVYRVAALITLIAALTTLSAQLRADTGSCGGASLTLPFTDVPSSNIFFCSIASAYFTGLTAGTSATTYSPAADVTREQMAAFITRTQDSALKRGSRRAAAGQWFTPQHAGVLNTTPLGSDPALNCFDGEDIWAANFSSNNITRVHASDGRVLGTWTGANHAHNTIAAAGFIYVTGAEIPGRIYRIDPTLAPGAVTEVEGNVGDGPRSITYDGLNLWTANEGTGPGLGSITRYNIITDTATTFGLGFNQPVGIVFDGIHLWVVDFGDDALYRVNPADGTILETLAMGAITSTPAIPIFDGTNIWVPVSNGLKVVSTSTPAQLLATLTGNGLGSTNLAAAFDGERIMVTNRAGATVSLWKASSLMPLGNLNLGAGRFPQGVCSDGLHFWIAVDSSGGDLLMRF
jgi:DNA-binding beta-propeller fold protein YncE